MASLRFRGILLQSILLIKYFRFSGPCSTGILINEVEYDNVDVDEKEWVELYDGGVGMTPLDGLVLTTKSEKLMEFEGKTTDANGFFVAFFDIDTLPNGQGYLLLICGDGPPSIWETETVERLMLMDAIVYEFTSDPVIELIIPNLAYFVHQEPSLTATSLSRCTCQDPKSTLCFENNRPISPESENLCSSLQSEPTMEFQYKYGSEIDEPKLEADPVPTAKATPPNPSTTSLSSAFDPASTPPTSFANNTLTNEESGGNNPTPSSASSLPTVGPTPYLLDVKKRSPPPSTTVIMDSNSATTPVSSILTYFNDSTYVTHSLIFPTPTASTQLVSTSQTTTSPTPTDDHTTAMTTSAGATTASTAERASTISATGENDQTEYPKKVSSIPVTYHATSGILRMSATTPPINSKQVSSTSTIRGRVETVTSTKIDEETASTQSTTPTDEKVGSESTNIERSITTDTTSREPILPISRLFTTLPSLLRDSTIRSSAAHTSTSDMAANLYPTISHHETVDSEPSTVSTFSGPVTDQNSPAKSLSSQPTGWSEDRLATLLETSTPMISSFGASTTTSYEKTFESTSSMSLTEDNIHTAYESLQTTDTHSTSGKWTTEGISSLNDAKASSERTEKLSTEDASVHIQPTTNENTWALHSTSNTPVLFNAEVTSSLASVILTEDKMNSNPILSSSSSSSSHDPQSSPGTHSKLTTSGYTPTSQPSGAAISGTTTGSPMIAGSQRSKSPQPGSSTQASRKYDASSSSTSHIAEESDQTQGVSMASFPLSSMANSDPSLITVDRYPTIQTTWLGEDTGFQSLTKDQVTTPVMTSTRSDTPYQSMASQPARNVSTESMESNQDYGLTSMTRDATTETSTLSVPIVKGGCPGMKTVLFSSESVGTIASRETSLGLGTVSSVVSPTRCAILCMDTVDCAAFSHTDINGECTLLTYAASSMTDSGDTVNFHGF